MEIVYDKSVTVIPKHLNLDFFEEIVENAVQEANPLIKKIFVKMGSSAGDNYCSLIYRVLITYHLMEDDDVSQHKQISVIIKSMPVTKSIDFLEDMRVFLKEKIFYNHVLPIMDIFTNDGKQFGAKLYQSLKKPINTLVFQDLGALGFGLASRELGMDEKHAALVLKRLAQFHSISLMVHQKDPFLMKCFNSGILAKGAIQRDDSTFYCLIKASCEALIDLAKTWQGYEEIVNKLENHLKKLRLKLSQMQQPQANEFQILNHGDMWVNNMMFKYNSQQQPQDVIFVDFQMSIWGSPGIDLNYFFYTSLPVKLLKERREHLIQVYYDELKHCLKELKYGNIPTYQQIREEVRKRELFGFFANHAIYPIISIDKEIASDSTFENFADREFAKKKFKQIMDQQKLKDMYAYTLLHFNEMKVFD